MMYEFCPHAGPAMLRSTTESNPAPFLKTCLRLSSMASSLYLQWVADPYCAGRWLVKEKEVPPRSPSTTVRTRRRGAQRCAVPACSSRRNLHDHHIIFRSRGGTNRRENRITVCAWHHL